MNCFRGFAGARCSSARTQADALKEKTSLVFAPALPSVRIMEKSWYQKWFRRSHVSQSQVTKTKAEHGDAEAQFGLALKSSLGQGQAPDYSQAARWYLKAAEQGHSLAQFNLGIMYAAGQGVALDQAQALMWFEKAARQGDAGAQFNLGMNHYRACIECLPKDAVESRIEAYKWFNLAEAQSYKGSASACEAVNLSMSREEVAEGNRRAAAFVLERPLVSESE